MPERSSKDKFRVDLAWYDQKKSIVDVLLVNMSARTDKVLEY